MEIQEGVQECDFCEKPWKVRWTYCWVRQTRDDGKLEVDAESATQDLYLCLEHEAQWMEKGFSQEDWRRRDLKIKKRHWKGERNG